MASLSKHMASRAQRGEVVGGGFFVFRRGRKSNRIKPEVNGFPFEHATLRAAEAEAARLAALNPGMTFVVLQQVSATKTAVAAPQGEGQEWEAFL